MGRRIRTTALAVVPAIGLLTLLVGYYALSMQRIPFLEGDTVVVEGDAFGFTIGMTRSQCLEVVRAQYEEEGNQLVVWNKQMQLATRTPISRLQPIGPALGSSPRWDIEMPAQWVNDLYLTFEADTLVEVKRSRWLYERP